MDVGKRLMLWLALALQLVLMAAGIWPAAWLVLRYGPAARTPGHWVLIILGAGLLFNYGYLAALILLRIVIPRPTEGHYPYRSGQRPPRQVIVYMFNALLVKARYETPWAAMFSAILVRVFPFRPLFEYLFGPRSGSMTLGDTIYCVDPFLVEIGKNVQLGLHCTILAHIFDNRGMRIRKVVIEDHAVIGAEAMLLPGVRVGRHAVVAVRSVVSPDSVIGPYEYWAGVPARKVKSLPRTDHAAPTDICGARA